LIKSAGATGSENLLDVRNGDGTKFVVKQSDGKVGIGTSSPARNLVVSSSGQTDLSILAGTSASAQLQFGDSGDDNIGQIEYNNSSNYMAFFTNASEKMRIDSSGLLQGCTSTPSSSVSGNMLRNILGVGANLISVGDYSSAVEMVQFINANGNVGSIDTSGSATSYNTSSDYRLKDVKGSIQNGLERTLALNPVEFAWKSDGTISEGFIAHEVQEAGWTEGVNGEKDAEEMQDMDYGRITPLLVKAIQELSAEVEQLKQQAHDKCDN
jgi:hypothetical protein